MLAEFCDIFSAVTIKYGIQLMSVSNIQVVDVSIFLAFAPSLHAAGSIGH
jgi:hypothetical protein